jgi:uncharacterized repeat protein (TIGR01451 family)
MRPIAEPIAGVLAICARAVSPLARLFDVSRPRGVLLQRDDADDGRLLSRLAGALARLGARAARYRVRSTIRTSCAALGVGIPVSVALMLLATQPAQAWEIGAVGITPINGTATRGKPFIFTLTVTNNGNAATSGTVTLRDLVPDGLTATSMNGTGWNCTLSPPRNSCTRSDALAAGASYPPISLFVSVDNDAPDLVFYQAFVSGGGYPNSSGTGVFEHVVSPPNLTITKAHNGNAIRGQIGFNYLITVLNAGAGPTDGTPVTVTDLLLAGLTATSMNGTGWNCTQPAGPCTRSDVLAAGASYPQIQLTVNVANNTPGLVTNSATVSGGGSNSISADDPTRVLNASNTHDFNGDGFSDILWRQTSGTNRGVALWLMNNVPPSAAGLGSLPANWIVAGARDLNGDGFSDILWSADNGGIGLWLMNGATIKSTVGVGTLPSGWNIVGTGDFNGDGIGDILLRGSNGAVAIWFMNSSGAVNSVALVGTIVTDWAIAGTGDFNSDGKWDILWRDTAGGGVAIWFMNGATLLSAVGVGAVPTTWTIAGTGDFDGDGVSDILWHDNSGATALWLMNSNGTLKSAVGLGSVATNWAIAGTGDFNNDGTSDILWQSSSGDVALWLMNAGMLTSALGVGSVTTDWQIPGMN